MKQDLLVQSEFISNKDYMFQCLLPCSDCRNKEKQFLITNNPWHALLTDYFVQIAGACSVLQAPCTEQFIFADDNEKLYYLLFC